MNVAVKVFPSSAYLKQNYHTPSHGNAPLEKSTDDKNLINSSLLWKTMGTVPCKKSQQVIANQETWTILVPQQPWVTLRASYQQPLAFPLSYWISGDPSLFQRPPHCPSCHCHLTAALYMPLGQTPLPVSPHWQHTQDSCPRSLTWRNHPLDHNSNQLPSGDLLARGSSLETSGNCVLVLLHPNPSQPFLGCPPSLNRF